MKKKTTFGKAPDRLSRLLALGMTEKDDQTVDTDPGDVTLEDFTQVKPGSRIGRYTLLEEVGEGGMATVYMAEQRHPIRRRVAVKLIKLGLDTKQVVARFEAERQALAMMDHPNIAKVLDAGTTDSGRPYFVMELVKGLPITEFCDKNHLSTQERLNLFVSVCQAIQHAHQRGIIHRDIKPSNVLVTLHDGEPVVKVIDFGIAKALNQQLTEKTVFTRYAQMIGTPEYMSPEQAEMSGLDIDTRTDVFSLGVLLYELLTGTTPFDSEYLLSKGYGELQRIIREEEPLRPSTRLSTMGEAMAQVATDRRTQPKQLCQLVRSDLDWIAMKCLEKDRSRRYESVSELSADMQRHLNHEPVLAGRPSTLYKLLKFTRRNRTLCVASVAVVFILIAAVIVSSHQAWNAHQARNAEHQERRTAEAQRDRAQAAEKQAEGHLYDALVREVRATRVARSTGYRSEVFAALGQASALDVPQKDLAGLRSQAIACLGDPVGREPLSLLTLPSGPNTPLIGFAAHHPTDPVAAFGLTSGAVILKDLNTAKEIARFEYDNVCLGLCFSDTGNALLSIHTPMGDSHMDIRYEQTVTRLFVRAQDGTWILSKTMAIPNVATCTSSAAGFRVIVLGAASRPARLMDPLTGDTIFEADFPMEINPMDHPQLDLSQDGRLFAFSNVESPDLDKSMLSVWDLVEHRRLVCLQTDLAACTGVKFSPDGRYIVYLSQSGGKVYSTETWRSVGHLTEQFINRPEAVFLADSTTLVFSLDSRVVLWDFKKQAVLAQLEQPRGGVKWLSASADGKSLVSYHHKTAWSYSLDAGAERLQISGHDAAVSGLAFSPDGRQLASVGMDRRFCIWDSVTGRPVWQRTLQGQGQAVSYSADGDWLITSDGDRDQVSIWSAKTTQRVFELDAERQAATVSAKLTRDNRHLVTANARYDSDSGSVAVWGLARDNSSAPGASFAADRVKSFPGQIIHASLSPDNRQCAFVKRKPYTEVYLYLWDMTGKAEPRLVTDDLIGGFAQMIEFSPDGQQIRAVDRHRCVVSYDVNSGEKHRLFPTVEANESAPWNWVIMHKLAPDGVTLAMSSRSGLGVDVWDMRTGRLLYALPEQGGTVHFLAWRPDGRRLAIARSNGAIEIWNMAEIDEVLTDLKLAP